MYMFEGLVGRFGNVARCILATLTIPANFCSDVVSMETPAKLSVCSCEQPRNVSMATAAGWQWATFSVWRFGRLLSAVKLST